MEAIKPVLLGIVFFVLHAWALATLWVRGPFDRRVLLVGVYLGTLVLSGLITKRFPPPLPASLILFVVVLAWRLYLSPGGSLL